MLQHTKKDDFTFQASVVTAVDVNLTAVNHRVRLELG